MQRSGLVVDDGRFNQWCSLSKDKMFSAGGGGSSSMMWASRAFILRLLHTKGGMFGAGGGVSSSVIRVSRVTILWLLLSMKGGIIIWFRWRGFKFCDACF